MAGIELATAYVSLTVAGDKVAPGVRQALGSASKEADKAGKTAGGRFGSTFSKAMESPLGKLSGMLGDLGLAAGIGGMVAAAFDGIQNKHALQAKLGLSPAEAAAMGKQAGEIYADNWGDSLEDVSASLATVRQNLSGLGKVDVKGITEDALAFKDTFGHETEESIRAVAQMLRTGLAKNATQAFDILTTGEQQGADKAGDLLDTFNEYGTQFRKLGINGKTALGLIQQGLQGGARDSDLVADAIKEFSIRAVDGSKTTADGFKRIGLNARNMAEMIGKGGPTAQKGLAMTLDGLRKIDDPAKRAQAAVELFGTQSEDLGQALYDLDPAAAKAQKGMDRVHGSTKRMSDAISATASPLDVAKRDLQTTFLDAGNDIAPLIEDVSSLVGAFSKLPAPIGKTAVEVGIALLAFNKLRSVAGPAVSGLRTNVGKLGGAAKTAAGAGGVLLLLDGMKRLDDQSSQTAGTIETTLGGALSGLAFGPWGALAGGVGGLLASLSKFNDTVSNPPDINPLLHNNLDLADSFDKVTGAATEATRSAVTNELQKKGLLTEAQVLGFSPAKLTDSILGVGDAASGVKKRLRDIIQNPPGANAPDSLQRMYEAAVNLDVAMPGLTGKFKSQGNAARQAILSNRGYIGTMKALKKNLPKDLVTHIRTDHLKGTLADIRNLQKQYKLTPKEVRTLARAEGIDPSSKAIRGLIDLAKNLGSQHPDVHVTAQTRTALDAMAAVKAKLLDLNGDTAVTYIRTEHVTGAAETGGRSPGHNASGTPYWRGGLTVVGENGPELINLQRGAAVFSNQRSKEMLRPAAAAPVAVAVTVAGPFTLTLDDGTQLTGMMEAIADERVDAAAAMAAQMSRAAY